jgi:uncharacterized GH25 family protein
MKLEQVKSMDKMVLMVKGHEIWIEKPKIKGDTVEFGLCYGHNMAVDGSPDAKKILSAVYAPDKTRIIPALKSGKNGHSFKFKAIKPGIYTAFVDMSPAIFSNTKKEGFKDGPKRLYKDVVYAGAWSQMAKTIFVVGENGGYKAETVHAVLDIVPKEISAKVGKTVELTVYYEGKSLPGIEVKAVSKKEGKEMASVITDKDGVARVPITNDGKWMFIVRHRDPSKAVQDQYDEAVFVTTLSMEAIKS